MTPVRRRLRNGAGADALRTRPLVVTHSPPSNPIESKPLDPFGAMITRVEPGAKLSGPLGGIRFCVKDNIQVAGQPFSAGHPLFVDRIASSTAPIVLSLSGLGGDFVGMTRTDAGGFGVTTPGVLNPCYPDYIVGGSSGGGAAAVAGGLADLALGTDTGGSVRIPAACAGLFGFKPTYGSLSTTGVWPLAPSYDHVGLLTRDLSLLHRVAKLLLPNEVEPKTPTSMLSHSLTIAIEQDAPAYQHPVVASWFRMLLASIEKQGHQVKRVKAPGRSAFTAEFGLCVLAEAHTVYADLSPRERDLLGVAAQRALAGRVLPEEYERARSNIDRWRRQYRNILEDVDVLLSPAMFIPPPPPNRHGVEVGERRWPLIEVLLSGTCFCNAIGSPALVMPARRRPVPLSLHLTARCGFDLNLLEIAEQLAPIVCSGRSDAQQ